MAFHWSTTWVAADEQLIEVKIGDCSSQARWEAYALLRVVKVWMPILKIADSQLAFCGDALAFFTMPYHWERGALG